MLERTAMGGGRRRRHGGWRVTAIANTGGGGNTAQVGGCGAGEESETAGRTERSAHLTSHCFTRLYIDLRMCWGL